ncbi:tRNA modification GTPase MnmE [Chlorella vulgaris]
MAQTLGSVSASKAVPTVRHMHDGTRRRSPAKRADWQSRPGCSQRSWRCRSLEQEYLSNLGGLIGYAGAQDDSSPASDGASRAPAAAGDTDTIAAIVTGSAQGAVSIIRVSGEAAVPIAQQVFTPQSAAATRRRRAESTAAGERAAWQPESHKVYYGSALDAEGAVLDEVLLLAMLAPRSYTSEDVVELHTHGGGVSAARVLQRCLEAGARLAQPGEFTLRAFLNGRLDLAQAESVAQLIDARTVAAADSALAGLAGGVGQIVQAMRRECLDLLVEMDVRIDFDEDLPPLDVPALVQRIQALSQQLAAALDTARQGQLLRSGLQVALVGRPNVGKSSLLNALSGTERAIVTAIAGTTRDIVEAGVVIGGVPITLLDTAGMRESSDMVEKIGVERSVAAARQADMVMLVVDAAAGWGPEDAEIAQQMFTSSSSGPAAWSSDWSSSSSDEEASSGSTSSGSKEHANGSGGGKRGAPALLVLNKVDLAQHAEQQQQQQQQQDGSSLQQSAHRCAAQQFGVPAAVANQFAAVVSTSAATREGLEALQQALAPGGVSWAVNERQGEALIRAKEALERVQSSISDELPVDFWTIDLRAAVLALGEVSGEDVTEELLDSIFSRFCIGK